MHLNKYLLMGVSLLLDLVILCGRSVFGFLFNISEDCALPLLYAFTLVFITLVHLAVMASKLTGFRFPWKDRCVFTCYSLGRLLVETLFVLVAIIGNPEETQYGVTVMVLSAAAVGVTLLDWVFAVTYPLWKKPKRPYTAELLSFRQAQQAARFRHQI
ncbi:unnamed protein product [Caenorhabditis sp. 36 PRJEB53466]|nr:unnamed protein product [Caenorhabditis sp. 36 PRJEB53466]